MQKVRREEIMKSVFVPKQHGAWAMLVVPFLLGMAVSKPVWTHALLFIAWLLAYLFIYPFLQWTRTGKINQYAKPMLVYGTLLVPAVAVLLALKPGLIWYGLVLLPLSTVNLFYAKINRERAFANDAAAVLLFSLMVWMSFYVGGGTDLRLAAELFGISVLYFLGTVLYVKTMIREKNNRTFFFISVGYHVAQCILVGILLSKWLLLSFVVLLLRAALSPQIKLTVKRTGILEIAYAIMMTACVWLTYL
jgi:hypothetical protein